MASNVGQHKRMAMGEKVTGMKSGGRVGMAMGGAMPVLPAQASARAGQAMASRPVMPPAAAQPMKRGGGVAPLKTGMGTSPLTDAKRANGVPGFKKGGAC